jgi:hypothetical protein
MFIYFDMRKSIGSLPVIFKVIEKWDDPVGNWFECNNCKREVFIPSYTRYGVGNYFVKYCPFCGKEIKMFK